MHRSAFLSITFIQNLLQLMETCGRNSGRQTYRKTDEIPNSQVKTKTSFGLDQSINISVSQLIPSPSTTRTIASSIKDQSKAGYYTVLFTANGNQLKSLLYDTVRDIKL